MAKKFTNQNSKLKKLLILIGIFLGFSLTTLWAFSFKDFQNFFEKKGLIEPEKKNEVELQKPEDKAQIQPTDEMRLYNDLEERVVDISQQYNDSVVSVIITKDLPVIEQYFVNPFENDPFFRQFFGDDFDFNIPQQRQRGTEKQEIGAGTGFIISEDGLILTNRHVVEDEKAEYTVLTNKGDRIQAKVLARHPALDLALLKIDTKGLKPLKLGDSDKVRVGQFVVAIGNALGEFRNTVSFGVVSGLQRNITALGSLSGAEQLDELIQTDAAINRGNSGGPLINMRGEVIGINTAIVQGAQNLGFAIPINKAKKMINEIKAKGKITFPFLGVRYVLINKYIAQKNNLSVDYGALVIRGENIGDLAVIPGSPADKAGLQENDIILEVNGQKITLENSLIKILSNFSPGDTIKLKILSKGREKTVSVTLDEKK